MISPSCCFWHNIRKKSKQNHTEIKQFYRNLRRITIHKFTVPKSPKNALTDFDWERLQSNDITDHFISLASISNKIPIKGATLIISLRKKKKFNFNELPKTLCFSFKRKLCNLSSGSISKSPPLVTNTQRANTNSPFSPNQMMNQKKYIFVYVCISLINDRRQKSAGDARRKGGQTPETDTIEEVEEKKKHKNL